MYNFMLYCQMAFEIWIDNLKSLMGIGTGEEK